MVIDRVKGAFPQGEGLGDEGRKIFLAGVHLGDQNLDLVFSIAVERLEFGWFDPFPINSEQREPLFLGPTGDLGVETFAPADEWSQEAQVFGGTELRADTFHDVRGGLTNEGMTPSGVW